MFTESAVVTRRRLVDHFLNDHWTDFHRGSVRSRLFLPRFVLPEIIGLALASLATLIGAIIFPNALVIFIPALAAIVVGFATIVLLSRRWGELGGSRGKEVEGP